jgi:hypothetical protein
MPRWPSTLSPDGSRGWQCGTSKHTAFVESAIRQAANLRWMDGNPLTDSTIHHSDYAELCVKARICIDDLRSWGVLVSFSA